MRTHPLAPRLRTAARPMALRIATWKANCSARFVARTLVGREEETELLRRITVCRSEIVGGIGDYRTFVQGYLVAIFVEYAATTTGLVVGDVAGGQR
jgi:hypothetical protein